MPAKKAGPWFAGCPWPLRKLRFRQRISDDERFLALQRPEIVRLRMEYDVPFAPACAYDFWLAQIVETYDGYWQIQRAHSDLGHAVKVLIVVAFSWHGGAGWLSLLLRIRDAFVFHTPCAVPVTSCNAFIDVLADANARS